MGTRKPHTWQQRRGRGTNGASKPISGDRNVAPHRQLAGELPVHHVGSAGPRGGMASDPRSGAGAIPDPDPEVCVLGAPEHGSSTGAPVLSIREKMAAEAKAKRNKPCPDGLCDVCYRTACRLLNIGQCICTGHIDPTNKTKFIQ